MSTNTVLGAVGVLPVGEWSSANTYNRLDIVTYQGSSYVAIDDVPLNTLPTDTTYWQLMSHRGDTGNGIVSIELTSTVGNVDTYTITYTNGDTDTIEVTNGNVSSVNGRTGAVTGLAENDGYYQQMTVGNAEQLVSTVFIEDKTPYTFRTSGGSVDIGDREYDEIVGGTVAWNQLAKYEQINIPSNAHGITYAYTDGTSVKISGTATAEETRGGWFNLSEITGLKDRGSHYVIIIPKVLSGNYTGNVHYRFINSLAVSLDTPCIRQLGTSGNQRIYTSIASGTVCTDLIVTFNSIDLTQMFGSTIADYIYTLEQNTPGAGVAWFRKLFPKDYYPYNVGTLLSVNASAHKMVGFNAYDHANSSAKVVGGNQYQITGTYTSISLDGTAITPDSDGYFTPSVSGTLSVVGGNATDTCIHLVWDGERDGEYEPYEVHNYPLDSSLTLRGIPKLDAGNNLYYDGDTYESDGTVTRKYGIVDMGTLTWTKGSGTTVQEWYSRGLENLAKGNAKNEIFSKIYVRATTYAEKTFYISGNSFVKLYTDDYSDAESLKTSLSGVYLVYELATPTTESADPFASPQIVNDFGTEEYVVTEQSGVAVPVGHITKYANNLRAKLEMAPDSPSQGDGDYIVRQTDGENEYVALSSNATVSGLTTRCPVCPTDTDGTYVLKATVSGGAVVYSWEAE